MDNISGSAQSASAIPSPTSAPPERQGSRLAPGPLNSNKLRDEISAKAELAHDYAAALQEIAGLSTDRCFSSLKANSPEFLQGVLAAFSLCKCIAEVALQKEAQLEVERAFALGNELYMPTTARGT